MIQVRKASSALSLFHLVLTFLSLIIILFVPMLLILCLKLFFFDYLQVHGRVFQWEISLRKATHCFLTWNSSVILLRQWNPPTRKWALLTEASFESVICKTDISTLLALGTHKGKITGVDFHNEISVKTVTTILLMDNPEGSGSVPQVHRPTASDSGRERASRLLHPIRIWSRIAYIGGEAPQGSAGWPYS